ncbi:MAG: DUF368 domain-containing protein [Verrucomicrobiales bacterium]|nr:DUF368 domain-containing protein [Verrucomicrobiales bacterium]
MNHLSTFLTGIAMGVANAIPGVSGGTIAFITGIYERLIHAVKSFDVTAIRKLLKLQIKDFSDHVDLPFLISLGLGVVAGILTLARLLKFLFISYETYVWSFFFGLILASIWLVGKTVKRWGAAPIVSLLIGLSIAVAIALIKPAAENDHPLYLVLCGVIAMASMIIPGVSGSFVLLLMGNYKLIMIESITSLNLKVLIPVGIGAVIGMITLSHLLSWIFKRYHDAAIALMTGFVAGSLLTIWPWKQAITQTFQSGDKVKEKVIGYDWLLPEMNSSTLISIAIILAGCLTVWLIELAGKKANRK